MYIKDFKHDVGKYDLKKKNDLGCEDFETDLNFSSSENLNNKNNFLKKLKKAWPVIPGALALYSLYKSLSGNNGNKTVVTNKNYDDKGNSNNDQNTIENNDINNNTINKNLNLPKIQKTDNKDGKIDRIKDKSEEIIEKCCHLEKNQIFDYLKSFQVSKEICNLANKINQYGGRHKCPEWMKVAQNPKSELYRQISNIIDSGDLPLRYVTSSDLDNLHLPSTGKAKFIRLLGRECWDFNKKHDDFDNSMMVVCSQYNALESVSPEITPPSQWYKDPTQGPAISMMAPIFALYRYIAVLKAKCNDALASVLHGCKSNRVLKGAYFDGDIQTYQNGYFNLEYAYKHLSTLEKKDLFEHIKSNIGKYRLNFQWVSGLHNQRQIQIFAAAPSMQDDYDAKWSDEKCQFYDSICEIIQCHQYRMIGKLATARSCALNGEPFNLHVWCVGGGAFNNSPNVIYKALCELVNIVKDYNINVYLHSRNSKNDYNKSRNNDIMYWAVVNQGLTCEEQFEM